MIPKKAYRNAIRSHQMIRDTFLQLLREKPFEKITATDVINRSGLNRSTFYSHYPDVKGILDEIAGEIVQMFRQMLNEMDFSLFLNDPEQYLKKVVSFLEENQELYRLLSQSDMALIYLEQLKKVLIQQVVDTPNLPTEGHSEVDAKIHIHMLMSGMIDTYRQWLMGEIECSLEQITGAIAAMIRMWNKQ